MTYFITMHLPTAIVLTVLFVYIPVSIESNTSCRTNCYESSLCCETYSTCQACRITCSTACRTQICANNCHRHCYERNICNDNCDKETYGCTSAYPTSRTTTQTSNFYPYPSVSPRPFINTINNTGNSTFETTLNLNNFVSSHNNISIPISVNNDNTVNVKISLASESNNTSNEDKPLITNNIPIEVEPLNRGNKTNKAELPKTNYVTNEGEPYPVPIPIPNIPLPQRIVYIPVPYPILVPVVRPGCCNIVNPCLFGGNCHPFTNRCGSECTSNNMYAPSNPCINGCVRRQYGISYNCFSSGYCQQKLTDCSMCSDKFYINFDNYRRCAGCFFAERDF